MSNSMEINEIVANLYECHLPSEAQIKFICNKVKKYFKRLNYY